MDTTATGASPDETGWDDFLATTPGGDIVQSTGWARVKHRAGFRSYRQVVTIDGRVQAGYQVLARSVPGLGGVGYVARGPVVAPDVASSVVDALVDDLADLCRSEHLRALVVQPPVGGERVASALRERSRSPGVVEVTPTASLRVPVDRDDETLLAGIPKKKRKGVRLARAHTEARCGSRDDLAVFHSLHLASAQRLGFPPATLDYLEVLWDEFQPHGQLSCLIAELHGRPVAGLLLSHFGAVTTHRLSGSRPEHSSALAHPNERLYWESFVLARALGHHECDLGGIDRSAAEALSTGTVGQALHIRSRDRFKIGFGGRLVLLPEAGMLTSGPVSRLVVGAMGSRIGAGMRERAGGALRKSQPR